MAETKDKKARILVVDDQPEMLHVFALKLQRAGFDVETAEDGEEALGKILKGKYDVIVLDLIMPNKDGFQVLEALQKKGVSSQIIVASNLGQPEDNERAKTLGAADFFIKSNLPLEELVERVKKLLK